MSNTNTTPSNDSGKTAKRNLPSWMSNRDKERKSHGKKLVEIDLEKVSNEEETPEQAIDSGKGKAHTSSLSSTKNGRSGKPSLSKTGGSSFSKLLEGVVFVLSGFVNPERSVLRSQAQEMGAEYQPDWNSNCTLLICAFPNTPKFRQVETDCGTIVSKEWISECFTQKKLVDIETFLMHAGKPWRRQNISHESHQDKKSSSSTKSQKLVERGSHTQPMSTASSKTGASALVEEHFFPSKVKRWAVDDLNKTISWLESQDEKPEPTEIKKIAAEGILTCIQDAIDTLEQKQDIKHITEQWKFIPRVVEELARLESSGDAATSVPTKVLHKHAVACKQIYEAELSNLDSDSSAKKKKKLKTGETESGDNGETGIVPKDAADSDETIEMTEEDIDLAYNTVSSKLRK